MRYVVAFLWVIGWFGTSGSVGVAVDNHFGPDGLPEYDMSWTDLAGALAGIARTARRHQRNLRSVSHGRPPTTVETPVWSSRTTNSPRDVNFHHGKWARASSNHQSQSWVPAATRSFRLRFRER
jgi:hypothetical protein